MNARHGISVPLRTRRSFLHAGSALGLSLSGLLRLRDASAGAAPKSQARSVVILYLSGGPSQLDTWDMKPEAPEAIRGTFSPIDTSVPGIQICEHMPRMARIADKYAIIRSMSHVSSVGDRRRPINVRSGRQALEAR